MTAVQMAVAANGSPKGASSSAATKGLFGGRASAGSSGDAFEHLLEAQFAALLQSGVPLAQIVERLSNAPPGSTAATQAAALARKKPATKTGGEAGEATTTAGQQNDISGEVLDAEVLAREHPAQHDTAAVTASGSTSLPGDMLARIAAALQVAQTPAPAPNASAAQPALAQTDATQAQLNEAATSPQTASTTTQASPDLLARMLVRAAGASAASAPASTAVAASATSSSQSVVGNASATLQQPGYAPSVDATDVAGIVRVAAAAAQNPANGGSGDGGALAGDGDRTIAKLLASDPKEADATTALGAPAFATALQNASQNLPTPQAAAPSAIDAEAVIAQIVKGISLRSNASGDHVTLRLAPESLGSVSMKVSVSGTQIDAVLTAQNADVRDLLAANAQQLARSFAGAGLKLGSFSVNVAGGNAHGDARRNGGQSAPARSVAAVDSALDAEEASEPHYGLPIASARGLMNYFA